VVCDEEYLHTVRKVKEVSPTIRSLIVVGEPREGCHTFKEMIKQDTFGIEFFKGSQVNTREKIAVLPYSSGTTGKSVNSKKSLPHFSYMLAPFGA